jgi:poly(3-hydroxybutyrate) depolymerase
MLDCCYQHGGFCVIKRLSAISFCAALLFGCATPPQPVQRIPFPVEEYSRLPTKGTGVVEGQAFLKTNGGDVKFGAGSEVTLIPVTTYSEQWYDVGFVQHKPITESDRRQLPYVRFTQADGNGNFKFTELPAGQYFISAEVIWQAPSPYGGTAKQGGRIANRITVNEGKSTRTMLTR